MLTVLGLAFSLSLILPGRRRTLAPPDAHCRGRCPQGVRRATRSAVVYSRRPSCNRSCMQDVMHIFTARSPLVSAVSLGFDQVVLATWSTACNSGCPVAYRPQTRQKLLLAPQPHVRHCVNTSRLTGLQALASLLN